jgi:hypothetical protein
MEEKLKQIKKFDKWMRKTVQSIHYSNNERMSNAYQKINS